MDRTMYFTAKRIADAHGDTFARWAYRAECCFAFVTDLKPKKPLCKLTRQNSISVAIHQHATTEVSPTRIRECIQLAIEQEDERNAQWKYKYDKGTMDAAITVELMLEKRTISYEEAELIIDKRIAERKAVIAKEEAKAKTKKGRK
jgi:hypothetical protein